MTPPPVAIIVQARMSSTRLPGKVHRPLAGEPAIVRMLQRVARVTQARWIRVATSDQTSDDPLAAACTAAGIDCVRGPLDDVLGRYVAALPAGAEIVVRLTGDCPLIDPAMIDAHIARFIAEQPFAQYVTNAVVRTFADGFDVEVVSRDILLQAHRTATAAFDREHVLPWVRRHARQVPVAQEVDLSPIRLTLDTPADYAVIAAIFDELHPTNAAFTHDDVMRLLVRRPELILIAGRSEVTDNERAMWRGRIAEFLAKPGTRPHSDMTTTNHTQALYERGRTLIPGGTQLLSKRPEMFLPGQWPAYYQRAKGCEVTDLDGRTYTDVTINGIGACPLGYADDDVDAAVIAAVRNGSMSTLNAPEEVELAELLCELHPWANRVRYARCGGEAMAMAVRIARAATGRERIAFCGYHGWHDWYLAANLADDAALDGHLLPGLDPAGVPRGLAGTAVPFVYGDVAAFDALIAQHGDTLAAIVMEPMRYSEPAPGYLAHIRETATRIGAVLVIDEITSAWRMNVGGLHMRLGVEPDMAVFAKAMSNGYPMAAIIGRDAVMEAAQRTFISSTYWTDRIGPAAAIATIRKLQSQNVPAHLIAIGQRMRDGWTRLAAAHGLKLKTKGIAPLSTFALDHGAQNKPLVTLYTQTMLDAGFLASGAFYATFAHQPAHIDAALHAADVAFAAMGRCVRGGTDAATLLRGPVAHEGFRRLT
ncbi:MAG: aminotransferase class III-fold pyridoxal phosphate-dependent enzyme [Planctomycetota bacterium]